MKHLAILAAIVAAVVAVTLTVIALAVPDDASAHPYSVQQENLALRRYISQQQVTIKSLRSQTASLRLRVTIAEAGLPTAIRGVSKVDFLRLVLMPAAEAYPCDGYSSTPTSWVFTFTSC